MTLLLPSRHASVGRLHLPALALLAAIVVGACGSSTTAASTPVPTNVVDLPKSYRFAPEAITVQAGTTVSWTNHDDFTHNVRLLNAGGGPLTMQPGETVTYTFVTPGLYGYTCTLHPNDMRGSVLVTE